MSRLTHSLFLLLLATAALPAIADDTRSMGNMDMTSTAPATKTAHGMGVVKGIDASAGTVTLSHQAIKELHWPAMTMSFKVASPEVLKGITVGQKVNFSLQGSGMKQVVTAIEASDPK